MTEPTGHTVTMYAGFGSDVTAPVIYVKELGDKRALVHVETNYHIEDSRDLGATYSTGSNKAAPRGLPQYRVSAKVFTVAQTYIYMGVFARK